MLTFVVTAGVVALAAPDSSLQDALHPIAATWLRLVALVSIALGHPFTIDVARDRVPDAVAH